jgi:hypothetical protein
MHPNSIYGDQGCFRNGRRATHAKYMAADRYGMVLPCCQADHPNDAQAIRLWHEDPGRLAWNTPHGGPQLIQRKRLCTFVCWDRNDMCMAGRLKFIKQWHLYTSVSTKIAPNNQIAESETCFEQGKSVFKEIKFNYKAMSNPWDTSLICAMVPIFNNQKKIQDSRTIEQHCWAYSTDGTTQL